MCRDVSVVHRTHLCKTLQPIENQASADNSKTSPMNRFIFAAENTHN